jgi:hypothetical protein
VLLNPSQLVGIKGNLPSANVCNGKSLFAHFTDSTALYVYG